MKYVKYVKICKNVEMCKIYHNSLSKKPWSNILLTQKNFLYIASATDFKSRIRIYINDIKTKKDSCGTVRHFNSECCDIKNPHQSPQVQLIESVSSDINLEGELGESEKYLHGNNSFLLITIAWIVFLTCILVKD